MAARERGVFTVRSAYKLGLSLMSLERGYEAPSVAPVDNRDIWRVIWKSNVPEKVCIFLWRAVQNSLATEMNKQKRNMQVTGLCPICAMEKEDGAHVFFRCTHAIAFWQAMREVWMIPRIDNLAGPREKWLEELLLSLSKEALLKG
jgi:hypothetical protein